MAARDHADAAPLAAPDARIGPVRRTSRTDSTTPNRTVCSPAHLVGA
jgi:hypothetical protein